MEWVALIAGEAHSDHPRCASPVLGAFARAWNDALDDHDRQRLRPALARVIGTARDGRDEERARRRAGGVLQGSGLELLACMFPRRVLTVPDVAERSTSPARQVPGASRLLRIP
ncbi:MAG: hypothetical protein M3N56_02075 [Actinomycetota bacterium]|nr:hypothetical protein [Actinomycetota bacterium]